MFVVVFFMILITFRFGIECVVDECCPDSVITFNNPVCVNNNQSINLNCPNGTLEVNYYDITKYNNIEHCYADHKWICTTNVTDVIVRGRIQKGLVICKEEIEFCELEGKFDNRWVEYVILIFFLFANLLSAALLITTSISYFLIGTMNDTQGICVRHYTLTLGLAHAVTSMNVFSIPVLANHICIIYVYVSLYFAVTSFLWMNLLAHGIWRSSRGHSPRCDKRTLVRYCAIGYGLPLIDLIIAFTNSFINNWGTDRLKNCYAHETSMMKEFVVVPIVVIMLLNLFYFLDSLRRLWNTAPPPNGTQNTSSTLRVVKFRVCLHLKLFVATGIIWTLVGISFFFSLFRFQIWSITILILASCEGIFIFIVLVATRKKVLQGLARRTYFGKTVFPTSWRDFHDSETQEADINVHYSNSNNQNNLTSELA